MTKQDLRAIYNGKCEPKKICINNSLFKSSKLKMLVYGAGAAWSRLFCLEPEPTQFRSEPEPAPEPRTSGAGAAQKKCRLRNADKRFDPAIQLRFGLATTVFCYIM